jgi:hypothetical protein
MILAFSHAGFDHCACAFRNAAQGRFVASMIAFRPAALILRFFRARVVDETGPDCFLDAAHFFRWAAAILARAAADIRRRLFGAGTLLSVALGFNIWRSCPISRLRRFFCSSKPAMAAATISVLHEERFSPPLDRRGVILSLGPTSKLTPKRILFQIA